MKLSGSHLLSFGWLSRHRQKGIKRRSVTPRDGSKFAGLWPGEMGPMSKRFQTVGFRGSTQPRKRSGASVGSETMN